MLFLEGGSGTPWTECFKNEKRCVSMKIKGNISTNFQFCNIGECLEVSCYVIQASDDVQVD